MSHFSDMLDNYIYECRLSVNELSAASGIDRTYISKLRSGTRIIRDEQKVKRLILALRCSTEQEARLLREYRIEAMGRARYEIIEAVMELLRDIGHIPNTPPMKQELEALDISGAVHGKNDVNSVISMVLGREAAMGSGHIRLVAQQGFEGVAQLLPGICRSNSSLRVEHLISLHSANTRRSDINNLSSLRVFWPSIICGCQYDFLYYYGEQSHINSNSLFPYAIITGRHVLAVSYEGDMALLYDGPAIIDAYIHVFENLKKQCRPIISSLTLGKRFDEFEDRFQQSIACGNTLMALSNTPALSPFITTEMIAKYLRGLDMGAMQLVDRLLKMYANISVQPSIKFFSEDGLRYFINHGKISGIPDSLYTPLDKEDRLILLKRWYELCRSDNYKCIAVQHNQMVIPNNMFLEATDVSNVILAYTHPINNNAFYMILEQSISCCMYEFLSYLQQGNLVHDEQYSMAMAGALIGELEQEIMQTKE